DRVAVLLARLFLGEADAAQGRVGEDDEGDVFVVELRIGLAAEDAIHEPAGGGDGDGGEGELAGDVADGVDAFGGGVLPGVDLDRAIVGEGDTCGFQANAGRVGAAADGEDHFVERFAGNAARVDEDQAAVFAPELTQVVAQVHADAEVAVVVLQLLHDIGVHLLEQAAAAGEHFRPAAKRLEDTGQFGADVAAAKQGDPARGFAPGEEVV